MKQLVAITLFLFACHKSNPNFQPDAPTGSGTDGGIDAAIDGPSGCTTNTTCSGTTPICQLADHTCIACATDSDCSGVGSAHTCLPNGACAGDGDVAYVTSGGSDTGNTCTFEAACQTVGYALANTSSAYISLTGTGSDNGVTIDRDVTLLGRGSATLENGSGGPIVTITGTANVSIYDVTIDHAGPTGTGNGVSASTSGNVTLDGVTITANERYGVNWTGTGTLTLTRSQITDNTNVGIEAAAGMVISDRTLISGNGSGGVYLSGTGFHIENTIIANNGGSGTNFGGVYVIASPNTSDTIVFSTIASNLSKTSDAGGVLCATQSNPLTFSNNIISSNTEHATLQTDGDNCAFTYTDFYPAESYQDGSGNGSGDPGLTADFHLDGTGSAVIDTADSTGAPTVDYFGTTRPQGSGYDMGAAEYMP